MNEFFLESEIYRDSQGNVTGTYEYTYDEDDNLIEEFRPHDGLSSSRISYTYDENGNLASSTSLYFGSLSSGSRTTYIYDENGNLATESVERDDDGFFNDDFDGVPDAITTYIYDTNNNLIEEASDNDADDVAETNITYTYDENHNLIEESYDLNVDGVSDAVNTYNYDENANLIAENIDFDLDGVVDYEVTYQYDTNNNLIIQSTDFDLDGIVDSLETNAYDANNNLISKTSESEILGNSIYTYSYDANNNLVTETRDSNADGNINETVSYSYVGTSEETEAIDESGLLLTDVHRFYQHDRGFHFYSADANEIDYVRQQSDAGELSYTYEAEQYRVLADNRDAITGEEIEGVEPIYRFFNNDTGAHLYTMNEEEKDSIIANLPNYSFEGVRYYAFESEPESIETIPVYRLFNTNSGTHLFSSAQNEISYIEENLPNFVMENGGNAVFYVWEL